MVLLEVVVVVEVVLLEELDDEDDEGRVDAVLGGDEVELVVDDPGVPTEFAR